MSDHTVTQEGCMTSLWVRMGELREIEARKRAEARLTDDPPAGGREPIGDPPPDDVPDDDEDDDDDDE
jgi:hypothetical protein